MEGGIASQNMVSRPDIFIEGERYRSNTFPTETNSELPIIDENDERRLGVLLRHHAVMGADGSKDGFLPFKLLSQILTRRRILVALEACKVENAQDYCDLIRPVENSGAQTYLRTFALLALVDQVSDIGKFIREGVSDQKLPVCRHSMSRGEVILCRKDKPDQPLSCFDSWKDSDRESFESKQLRLLVPYFDLDPDSRAKHHIFDNETILPWCKKDDRSHSSSQPSGQEGGYGFVSRIKIDPYSHGFHTVLEKIGFKNEFFALKMLHDEDFNNEQQFRNELEQLKRFNGLVHDHLVTLLTTFTLNKRYYFLFPYADSTLDQYWEKRDPNWDLLTVRWVSKQCSGIMAAIDSIHDPKHLQNLTVMKYGRHGDIKPDNILWFQSSKDPNGILVVSDMGLSSFNRDTSRSNIPNSRIPKVPGYRPPECDVQGGTISRAYDIWTLGCLFLELLTWSLGGWKLVEQFQEKRKSVYITGALNNIFFTLKKIEGSDRYVAQVKHQVTKWIDELHNHEHCSQFIHDALDVIKNDMLVVLSKDRKRASSGDLRKKFGNIHSQCMDDKRFDYCLKGVPNKPMLTRAATAVEVHLNEMAKSAISEHKPDLSTFDPAIEKMREAMQKTELENMDQV
ncbi:kinase-like domain-containing protein [Xylogone sp. PMI_703]|nr:kinase-like domain-containing protein [Xylogone sp. PMI_703]